MYTIVGLGNPGEEYENTRHNTGKIIAEKLGFGSVDEFMNNSGKAIAKKIKSKKAATKLIIIHDDLDLPIGSFKISYNRGPGGHRGVGSIIKALKSQEFTRIRVGISKQKPNGQVSKPKGEEAVLKFILGTFKPDELKVLNKLSKKISEAISLIEEGGPQAAMNAFN